MVQVKVFDILKSRSNDFWAKTTELLKAIFSTGKTVLNKKARHIRSK